MEAITSRQQEVLTLLNGVDGAHLRYTSIGYVVYLKSGERRMLGSSGRRIKAVTVDGLQRRGLLERRKIGGLTISQAGRDILSAAAEGRARVRD